MSIPIDWNQIILAIIGLANIYMVWKLNEGRKQNILTNDKLDEQTGQSKVIEEKITQVHDVVNSKSDIAKAEILELKGQVTSLTNILKEIKVNGSKGNHKNEIK